MVTCDNRTRPRERRASAPLIAGERYELGETIGSGGMGEIILAYDLQIGREVAIKRMHAADPTPEQLSRFLREARIQGRLEHPSIPPVHELTCDAEGRPFFVMKMLGGTTLAHVLAEPSAPRTHLLRAFVEVCRALELAHERRILHRDIKPANILLENGVERVKITDFGLARTADDASLSQSGVVAGTPLYMSPEQASGAVVDCRSDLFSLGSVLYAMCAGRPPFRATSTMAVLKRVCEDTPTPVQEVGTGRPLTATGGTATVTLVENADVALQA